LLPPLLLPPLLLPPLLLPPLLLPPSLRRIVVQHGSGYAPIEKD
jgi:hypothetical protein